jgi:hypothetical protein
MRIAHIIIAHTNPNQLRRLISRLQHPNADFYLHIDLKVDITAFKSLLDLPNVTFIKNRINCNWGGNSLFIGIISALKEVLSLNQNHDYINLLSGQDYPLMPPSKIHDYLKKNAGISFISYETDVDSAWLKEVVHRYEKYHLTDMNFKWKYTLQKVLNTVLPLRKFPITGQFYGGNKATWWTVTTDSARYVIEQLQQSEKLIRSLKYCWGTDEFVFSSLLMNSPFKDQVVNNNLRYIDWSEGKVNPKLFRIADFESLKQSEMMFARKFDMLKDPEILDKIDRDCLGWS